MTDDFEYIPKLLEIAEFLEQRYPNYPDIVNARWNLLKVCKWIIDEEIEEKEEEEGCKECCND